MQVFALRLLLPNYFLIRKLSIFLLQRAFCAFCHDRIWGLGRQGFKCIQCKLLVHKKCHKLVQMPCTNEHVEPIIKEDHNGESQALGTPINEIISENRSFPEPPPDVTGIARKLITLIVTIIFLIFGNE